MIIFHWIGRAISWVFRTLWSAWLFFACWLMALCVSIGCLERAARMRRCALGIEQDPEWVPVDGYYDPDDPEPEPEPEPEPMPGLAWVGPTRPHFVSQEQTEARRWMMGQGLLSGVPKGQPWRYLVGVRWEETDDTKQLDELVFEFDNETRLALDDPKEIGMLLLSSLRQVNVRESDRVADR